MSTRGAPRWPAQWRPAAWAVLGLAVAASGWAALALAQGPGRLTTYAGWSVLTAALTIGAGAALGVAGLVAGLGGSPRSGALTLFAAVVWFAPLWVGWHQGPLLVRSIGMVAAGFVLPLLLHVALAFPGGRLPTAAARAVVAATYAEAALVAVANAVSRDPFFDPYCWANCTGNEFVVRSFPDLARAVVVTDQWFTAAAAVTMAALCTWRLVTASPPARATLLPVAAPAVVVAATVAARALTLVRRPLEDPADPVFREVFVVHCSAVILLAAGLVWGVLRTRLQHRAVSRIASVMGEAPPPGSLQAALGRAVGDPTLRILYWLPGSARYVDASGRAMATPATEPGRTLTTLVRDDQLVAMVSHARGVPEIEPAMGPAFTLALDNERLQAETLAQLEELRASRSRIVEAGDQERRRLERDLHDGAQQRLLSASYEIRLATASATTAGDTPTAELLGGALEGTLAALEELRVLAHGLYPAILEEAGLAAAVTTLTDTAPLAVDTRRVTAERYPAAVEIAAYQVVAECVDDAVARRATTVAVEAARDDGVLVVTVSDDGGEPLTTLVRSADRVGALGGTLESGPNLRRAEIPCA